MDVAVLAALAEPNRARIVELLNRAPRAVGEIASALDLRQPQVTKHLQTLERAGLVTVHPLGQRRIYALNRRPLRDLHEALGRFGPEHDSEAVLVAYGQAIADEAALAGLRTVRLRRTLPASPRAVWPCWTSAELIRRWWSPEHFTVAEADADPVAGGVLRIVMEEGDGTRHAALGRYLELDQPRALSFELAPLGTDGAPLLTAVHHVRLTADARRTRLSLTIRAGALSPAAAPALAGLRLGWGQLLDKLARELDGGVDA